MTFAKSHLQAKLFVNILSLNNAHTIRITEQQIKIIYSTMSIKESSSMGIYYLCCVCVCWLVGWFVEYMSILLLIDYIYDV